MQLHDYQKAVLREAYRRDGDGKFIYDVVVWSDIKKSAKSSIAAAVMLHRALLTEWGSFKVVANDLEQANSRVFYYIQRAIALNPVLTARATTRNYKITLDNHATITAVPIDPGGEAGGNDDMIEWTELHAASSKAALEMWTEMTISPTKYGYSQRWIDTYAGHISKAPILEQLYEMGVKQGERFVPDDAPKDTPPDLELYRNGKLLVLWNTHPQLEWQTDEYYQSEAAILTPDEFNRIHRNQWAAPTEGFIPAEWWDMCYAPELPPLTPYSSMVVGIDAGVSSDCFAIVGVTRHGDNIIPRFIRKWIPPQGGKLAFSNPHNPDDMDTPEGVVRWLAKTYPVIEFAYDEYQLADFASRMRQQGIGWFNAFSQGSDRAVADKQLYDLIRERRLLHDGNPDLREHILNADKAPADNGKLRLVKRHHDKKIDLAVSLSMCSFEALRLNLGS